MFNRNFAFLTVTQAVIFIALTASPTRANADAASVTEKEAPHTRNQLFLRAQLGFGRSSSKAANADTAVDVHGMGHAFSFSGGYTLRNNLAIYGQISQHGSRNPNLTIDNNGSKTTASPNTDLLVATTAVGLGITQYFSDFNLFWDASVGVGFLGVAANGDSDTTDLGPTAALSIGKEWLVGPHLGVGVSAQLHLSRVHDADAFPDGTSGHFTSTTMALGISGTYN
ncbi:MAG: hypothetical protein SGI86_00100 [Deltaproteobacteria bacterium]|nr:hypothetical protein [Deltaproteobacteria bacterium]